jgi:hypothetical protein
VEPARRSAARLSAARHVECAGRRWRGAGAGASTPGFGGIPFPNPAAMFAALDPAEVERKIGELRVIENWLAVSLGMMQMSIKTLELQKASLEALRGTARAASDAAHEAAGNSRNSRKGKS